MDFDTSSDGNKRIFSRLGPPSDRSQPKVCYQWQSGRCYRLPCPFLHTNLPPKRTQQYHPDDPRSFQSSDPAPFTRRNPNPNYSANPNRNYSANPNYRGASSKWGRGRGRGGALGKPRAIEKVCSYWIAGKCSYGESCKYLHTWFIGESFTFLTLLEGHQKGVIGIALPSGSDKLYTGSKDESVRVWDCQTGQCIGVVNLGGEIGCLISEGPWIFVGLPSVVKAWHTQSNTELSLSGPVGQVYALVASNDMLFAGTQGGSILAWTFNAVGNCFEPAASLIGHGLAVMSLVVGAGKLYSSSMDHTIKVWDLGTLQCIHTLTDHTSVVMSVLCWDQFLLSCSLDKTIKVWAATETGNLEVTYTHNEEHGVVALCGMHDMQDRPVLLCSCSDKSVRLYDLPSFSERGKMFSEEEVRAIQTGPGGLFFTGDGRGELKVWKWSTA
ncbi:zinc finger CCCH domain-containing protein 48 [Magnolia sinica]|uniref:zinc finger CCCH domain-containing protein 48 n=1 Tax=Magnolia sinica TaxID=86752 RepID=UPI00265A0371|nr:zinc finger CCCH domain-containing protein 48 [Magnolia sinica]